MKTIKITASALLCLCLYLTSLTGSAASDQPFEAAIQEVKKMYEEADVPGISVIMVSGGEHRILNLGYADADGNQPVTDQTHFQLASCSKAFTALAFMKLKEAGLVNLEDHVSDYLPWFKVMYNGNQIPVELGHLLHHTSGIPWNTIADIPESNDDDALLQTVRTLIDEELNHPPGSMYEYATINYDVLALVIQQATGQRFESYLTEQLLKPLGMLQTTIGVDPDMENVSAGFKSGYFTNWVYDAPIYKGNNAAGYVVSNAQDMVVWLQTQLGQANKSFYHLVKETHQRDKSVAIHGMESYGAGWEISMDGTGRISHSGANPNFTSFVILRPEEQSAIAVLANSNTTFTALIADNAIRAMLGEGITRHFDPGDNGDKIYSLLSMALMLYIGIVATIMGRMLWLTFKGERRLTIPKKGTLLKMIIAVVALLPFAAGAYLFPQAVAGFNWESIVVWTPISFLTLAKVVVVAVGISYLQYVLAELLPEPDYYKRKVPQIVLFSVLSGLANVVVIIMVTSALNTSVELKYMIFYYVLILGIYLLGRRFVQVQLIKITRGMIYDMRIKLVGKIFSTSYQNFEKIDKGKVYSTMNDDINRIGESTNIMMMLITSVITTLGAFIYLGSIAFWATLIVIFLILALSVTYSLVAQKAMPYFEKARDEQTTYMGLLSGMVEGFKELSLHVNKKLQYKDDVNTSAKEYKEKVTTADTKFVNAFLVGESLLVILLGAVAFGMGELFPEIPFYTVMSFVIVLLYLIGPIGGILNSAPVIMGLKVAWNRVQEFIEEIPATSELVQVTKVNRSVDQLKVEDIHFAYPGTKNDRQFSVGPINFEVASGEVIFIIGGNGSGKTTFAKLITGLYQADSGSIVINGKEVKHDSVSEYYSTVFTPPYIFDKIYHAREGQNTDQHQQLLETLELQDKVSISDMKYDTTKLSGGQRKRLGLLQCYMEDSPIFLFDEWAAEQDPEYRKFFYRTLIPEMRKQGKIVIAITHDDHYFDEADRIYKMSDGQLIEVNTESLVLS